MLETPTVASFPDRMRDFGIPEVVGDPAGMRALATRLRADADRIGTLAGSVKTLVGGAKMEGPAAKRMRTGTVHWHGDARDVVEKLRDTASYLDQEAREVELRQEERRRTIARLLEQERERMRDRP